MINKKNRDVFQEITDKYTNIKKDKNNATISSSHRCPNAYVGVKF